MRKYFILLLIFNVILGQKYYLLVTPECWNDSLIVNSGNRYKLGLFPCYIDNAEKEPFNLLSQNVYDINFKKIQKGLSKLDIERYYKKKGIVDEVTGEGNDNSGEGNDNSGDFWGDSEFEGSSEDSYEEDNNDLVEFVVNLDYSFVLEVKETKNSIKAKTKYLYIPDMLREEGVFIKFSPKNSHRCFYYVGADGYLNVSMKDIVKRLLFGGCISGYLEDGKIIRDKDKLYNLKSRLVSRIDTLWSPKVKKKLVEVCIAFYKNRSISDLCYKDIDKTIKRNSELAGYYKDLIKALRNYKIPFYLYDSDLGNITPLSVSELKKKVLSFYFNCKEPLECLNKNLESTFLQITYLWIEKGGKRYLEPKYITVVFTDPRGVIPDEALFSVRVSDLKKLDFDYKGFIELLSDYRRFECYPIHINDYTLKACDEAWNYYKVLFK